MKIGVLYNKIMSVRRW